MPKAPLHHRYPSRRAPPRPRSPEVEAEIEDLRTAARRRAAQTSIRQLAIELGCSHGAAAKFVNGKVRPYWKQLQRLRAWHLRVWTDGGDGLSLAIADRMVALMVSQVCRDERSSAHRGVLEAIERVFRENRVAPPPWIEALRRGSSSDGVHLDPEDSS